MLKLRAMFSAKCKERFGIIWLLVRIGVDSGSVGARSTRGIRPRPHNVHSTHRADTATPHSPTPHTTRNITAASCTRPERGQSKKREREKID